MVFINKPTISRKLNPLFIIICAFNVFKRLKVSILELTSFNETEFLLNASFEKPYNFVEMQRLDQKRKSPKGL